MPLLLLLLFCDNITIVNSFGHDNHEVQILYCVGPPRYVPVA